MAAPGLASARIPDPECVLDLLNPEEVSLSMAGGSAWTFRRELVLSLIAQVNRGFEAAPHGGIEIGGLLVGAVPEPGKPQLIHEAIPVEIEYRYGPNSGPPMRTSPLSRKLPRP